jgi:hypothetical protein
MGRCFAGVPAPARRSYATPRREGSSSAPATMDRRELLRSTQPVRYCLPVELTRPHGFSKSAESLVR